MWAEVCSISPSAKKLKFEDLKWLNAWMFESEDKKECDIVV